MTARFLNNCIGTSADDLNALHEMINSAKRVSRQSFLHHVDRNTMRSLESELGYASRRSSSGLTMARDWHVGYFKSTWKGAPAWFFRWSAIEYYFVEEQS